MRKFIFLLAILTLVTLSAEASGTGSHKGKNKTREGKSGRKEVIDDKNVFKVDEEKLDQSFQRLNDLETFVNENNNPVFEDVAESNPELVEGLMLSTSIDSVAQNNNHGVSNGVAFLIGCGSSLILSPIIGLVAVIAMYFICDEDKRVALWTFFGCAAATLLMAAVIALLVSASILII